MQSDKELKTSAVREKYLTLKDYSDETNMIASNTKRDENIQ